MFSVQSFHVSSSLIRKGLGWESQLHFTQQLDLRRQFYMSLPCNRLPLKRQDREGRFRFSSPIHICSPVSEESTLGKKLSASPYPQLRNSLIIGLHGQENPKATGEPGQGPPHAAV